MLGCLFPTRCGWSRRKWRGKKWRGGEPEAPQGDGGYSPGPCSGDGCRGPPREMAPGTIPQHRQLSLPPQWKRLLTRDSTKWGKLRHKSREMSCQRPERAPCLRPHEAVLFPLPHLPGVPGTRALAVTCPSALPSCHSPSSLQPFFLTAHWDGVGAWQGPVHQPRAWHPCWESWHCWHLLSIPEHLLFPSLGICWGRMGGGGLLAAGLDPAGCTLCHHLEKKLGTLLLVAGESGLPGAGRSPPPQGSAPLPRH